jgi:hypothetical protein
MLFIIIVSENDEFVLFSILKEKFSFDGEMFNDVFNFSNKFVFKFLISFLLLLLLFLLFEFV